MFQCFVEKSYGAKRWQKKTKKILSCSLYAIASPEVFFEAKMRSMHLHTPFRFQALDPYGTDRRMDGRARRVLRPIGTAAQLAKQRY